MDSVSRGFYSYAVSEKAKTLWDNWGGVISAGDEKSRLHLLAYVGDAGTILMLYTQKKLETPKLGLIDRHFYVLFHQKEGDRHETWYKINKSSLRKRMNLEEWEMETLVKDGECDAVQLQKLVQRKKELQEAWQNITVRKGQDTQFIDNFIAGLAFTQDQENKVTNVI